MADDRPMSVQRLERTCVQLQAIVEEQEKAIKIMEKAIKDSVTKNHVEILLNGKVTQQDLQGLFGRMSNEIESMLGKKADFQQVETMLQNKASMATIESLRNELNELRDSIRAGDGLESFTKKSANTFDEYQKSMREMLERIRDEQKQAREEEIKRLAAERAKQPIRTGRFREDGSEILLNPDGTPYVSSEEERAQWRQKYEEEMREKERQEQERIQLTEREKKELKDKIHRMELAIQLANAQRAARGALDARGRGGDQDEEERIEAAIEARTGKMKQQLNDLRAQCQQSEKDIERMMKLLKEKQMKMHEGGYGRAGAGGDGLGGTANDLIKAMELQSFMKELADLQKQFASGQGQSSKGLYEKVLLPKASELSAAVAAIQNLLKEQARATRRLMEAMNDAKFTVKKDVHELFAEIQALKRRLKTYTEQFAKDFLENIGEHRAELAAMSAWRHEVDGAFREVQHVLGQNRAQLQELQLPVHDQLRTTRVTELALREGEIEERFEKEYGKLRERYEEVRAKEAQESEQREHARWLRQQDRMVKLYGPGGEEEEKELQHLQQSGRSTATPYGRTPSPMRHITPQQHARMTRAQAWSMYADVADAFATSAPESPSSAAAAMRPRTSFQPSPPPSTNNGTPFLNSPGDAAGAYTDRPRTSPLKGPSSRARRGTWNTTAAGIGMDVSTPQHSPSTTTSSPRAESPSQQFPSAPPASSSHKKKKKTKSSRASSASYARPKTSPAPPSSSHQLERHAPLYYYTPSPESSFQTGQGIGPKWSREQHNSRLATPQRTSSNSPPRSPERRDENGHLLTLDYTPASTRPSSRAFNLKQASRSRPISGTGLTPHQRQMTTLTPEYNDVNYSLELLRQRLSIPAPSASPPPFTYQPASLSSSPQPLNQTAISSPAASATSAAPTSSSVSNSLATTLKSSTYAPLDPFHSLHQPFHTLPGDSYQTPSPHSYTPRTHLNVSQGFVSGGSSKSSRMSTNVGAAMRT